jgi:tRNA pseudouridine13 synthase
MKVKQRPEDFQVEELARILPGDAGQFALYRLDKTGWTTPDALAAIRRRWNIDFRRMSYGGLKDRHATTSQFLTIFNGPKRNLSHERINLSYLGRRTVPFTASDITANRFTITLRSLNDDAIAKALSCLEEVNLVGIPNYFDDQRFGSVGEPAEFVAKEMVLGHFERALWLALAAPYEFDRAETKKEKVILRSQWGNWSLCKEKLPRGHARSLVDYLIFHPNDFKGAVARLRPELQGLYLSAYQSYLWNRLLGDWLIQSFGRENLGNIELKLGEVPVPLRIPKELNETWRSLALPLLSARLKPEIGTFWLPFAEKVLHQEGLTLKELKIKGLQKPFFSRGDRAACVCPTNLFHLVEPDDLNQGRRKLTLKFDLPRGSYATMLIKRVTSCIISQAPDP